MKDVGDAIVGSIFVICFFVTFWLFKGSPDLHDVLIQRLSVKANVRVVQIANEVY